MITKQEMKKLRKGDLVYLPSEVILFKFGKDAMVANRITTTSKPMTTALVSQVDNLCEVLYNGEIWSVETNNIFLGGCSD
mgnify:FL=1